MGVNQSANLPPTFKLADDIRKKIDTLFNELDTNYSGTLDINELKAMYDTKHLDQNQH